MQMVALVLGYALAAAGVWHFFSADKKKGLIAAVVGVALVLLFTP